MNKFKKVELENGNYKIINYYSEEHKIHDECYYNSNGIEYRSNDLPSYISYYRSGKIKVINYWIKDNLHRLNGPALNWYYESGKIKRQEYHIHGEEYSKEEFEKESKILKNINKNLKLLDKR